MTSSIYVAICLYSVWYMCSVLQLAGAPCNNFKGFCDVFQICRDVDADGPLARLKDFLLNTQTLNDVVNWMTVRPSFGCYST